MSPPASPAGYVLSKLPATVRRRSARIWRNCTQAYRVGANKRPGETWVPASAGGWYTEGPRPDNGVDDRTAVDHNEEEVTVGAGERDVVHDDSNWSPMPAPGRGSWHFGFAVLPILFGIVPWLFASQEGQAPTAEPLEIEGDTVSRLVPTVSGAGALYVVGDEGLYRGDSAGANWELIGDAPPPGQVVAAADGSEVMLAGDTPVCGRGDGGTPLSRSSDGGATWEEVPDVADIEPLAIWGQDAFALGARCDGLHYSLDNGDSWSPVDGLDPGRIVTAFAVVAGDEGRRVLVGTTSEGGTSQLVELDVTDPDAIEVSEPLKEYYGLGAVAGAGAQRVLAGPDGVWVSIDRGEEWTLRTGGLEDVILSVDPLLEAIPIDEMDRGFGLNALGLDPTNAGQMVVGAVDGLYVSADAGAEWTRVEGVDGEVEQVVISEVGSLVLAQTENEVVSALPWDT